MAEAFDKLKPDRSRGLVRYDEQAVETALLELAVCGGNRALARRRLKEAGMNPVPSSSLLREWVAWRYAERYEELRTQVAPRIRAAIASQQEQLAREAGEAAIEAVAKTRGSFGELAAKEMPGAARDLAAISGLSADKALRLRGEPSQIVEVRKSVDGLWARLETLMGGSLVVDAQVVDAEVVEEGDSE
jgi:hypothetical protein